MIAQGVGSLAADIARIALGVLRATVPDLMVLGGFGVAVWGAYAYSAVAGRFALAIALIVIGIAANQKKPA